MEWWLVMKGKVLIIDEIKKSYKLIILGVAISAFVMTVAVLFLNFSEYMMPTVSGYFDSAFGNGIGVTIKKLKADDLDILKDYGIKDIDLIVDSSTQLNKSSMELVGTEKEISGQCVQCVWLTEDNLELYEIPQGLNMEDFNFSDEAIVYCNEKDRNDYKEGMLFSLQLKNGKVVNEYKIVAIVEDNNLDEPNVCLPSVSVIKNMEERGIVLSYYIDGILNKPSKYVEVKSKINKRGADMTCNFDKILSLISILKMAFRILGIFFVIISVFVILILSIININLRERFMILQKILGIVDATIIFVYFTIWEIQIVVADILGTLLGFYFSKYVINIMGELYGIKVDFHERRMKRIFLIALLVSNVALMPFIFVLKRIVNKKDIVAYINNKD